MFFREVDCVVYSQVLITFRAVLKKLFRAETLYYFLTKVFIIKFFCKQCWKDKGASSLKGRAS